jgi:hypothetical protein
MSEPRMMIGVAYNSPLEMMQELLWSVLLVQVLQLV